MDAAATQPRGLFFREGGTGYPRDLEFYVRVREPNEFHFYARGATFADFASLFGKDVRKSQVIIYHIPPSLLNESYWEPLTREGEDAVRRASVGIITREEGRKTHLWRSDQVPPGRMLRDGLDAEAELLLGFAFRVSGEDLLKLGAASAGRGERFEWISFSGLPEGKLSNDTILLARSDITQMRLSLAEEGILYASQDERSLRLLFAERTMVRRAVSALLRGAASGPAGGHVSHPSDRFLDQVIRIADGVGLAARSGIDYKEKERTVEITAALGKTEWGVHIRPGDDPLVGDEKVLIYYDRVSGLWAITT